MPWGTAKGFNFRNTLAYVNDGLNETDVLTGVAYPVTRTIGGDSVTFGWEAVTYPTTANRDSSLDRRLAGVHFDVLGVDDDQFRVDLPNVGYYRVRLALGDATAGRTIYAEIRDTATVLRTYDTSTSGANTWRDALNIEYTNVTWPGSNSQATDNYTTTIFRLKAGDGLTKFGYIAHLQIEPIIVGESGILIFPRIGWV